MQIIRGKIPGAKKTVVYGPEGIGKSTFAAQFPDPVFIDTEGSTKDMDVARLEAPSSWSMLMEQVRYAIAHPDMCRSLILDTADWAEMLCITHICSSNQKSSIEEFGYGKGYIYVQEEFGRLLNLLEDLVDKGVQVVLTAHAKMRKFEQPDEMGAYDRWEMKLSKNVAPMVKEWADMVLFCNYKTMVVNVDGQGAQKGKNKAQGGKRVMYTTHHSCWDAKNRYSLPDELPFDYAGIAHVIESAIKAQSSQDQSVSAQQVDNQVSAQIKQKEEVPVKSSPDPEPETKTTVPVGNGPESVTTAFSVDERIPQNLRDLMMANQVCEWDIQNVVAARGYFPADVEVYDYPKDFIDGCLVAAWGKVYPMIVEMKNKDAVPFN